MNHIYRTVWNEITRSFVAAAETVKSHGKRASSKSCTASAESAVGAAPARRGLVTSRLNLMRLEPRLVFDGAAVDTVVAVDTHAQEQQAPVADKPVTVEATPAVAQPVTTTDTREAVAAVEGSAPYTALLLTAADPAQRSGRVEIAFVEDSVADWQSLASSVPAGVEVVKLDSRGDGLKQIADYLANRSDVDAIHILSHGSDGQVNLGALTLNSSNLDAQANTLAQIGQALTAEGDILLYGCEVSQSGNGQAFISEIAQLTQADVAASSDLTGDAAKGGDWQLEVATGAVNDALSIDGWGQVLVDPVLGGVAVNGNLKVTVLADGTMVIDRFDGTNWNTQFYDSDTDQTDGIYSSGVSSGSVVEINGKALALNDFSQTGSSTLGIQVDTPSAPVAAGRTITVTYTITAAQMNTFFGLASAVGDLTIAQRVTLINDTDQFVDMSWQLTNDTGLALSNIRLAHVVDSYLAGGDSGQGYWNPNANTVGVIKTISGIQQKMTLQGITAPADAESRYFQDVIDAATSEGAGGLHTTGNIDEFAADDPATDPNLGGIVEDDNGYAMEWVIASLASGANTTIEARASFVVNDVPTLTAVTTFTGATEDTAKTITFADLQTAGNDADTDGTVTGFVVKSVTSGTLTIGGQAWNASTNNTIDATHSASWTPAANANSALEAFKVVALDDQGTESATPVAVSVTVAAVQDQPVLQHAGVLFSTNNSLSFMKTDGTTELIGSLSYAGVSQPVPVKDGYLVTVRVNGADIPQVLKADGTLTDVALDGSNPLYSGVQYILAYGNSKAVMLANVPDGNGSDMPQLLLTDGTEANTQNLTNFSSNLSIGKPTISGNKVFFRATTISEGEELWVADLLNPGTPTQLELTSGVFWSGGWYAIGAGIDTFSVTAFNDGVVFTAAATPTGQISPIDGTPVAAKPNALYFSNGTTITQLATGVFDGKLGVNLGSKVIIAGRHDNGNSDGTDDTYGTWVTDGTAQGTTRLQFENANLEYASQTFNAGNGKALIVGNTSRDIYQYNSATGVVTKLVDIADPNSTATEIYGLLDDGTLVINFYDITQGTNSLQTLNVNDSTPTLTLIKDGLRNTSGYSDVQVIDGKIWFTALYNGSGATWVTDGTTEGTAQVSPATKGSNGFYYPWGKVATDGTAKATPFTTIPDSATADNITGNTIAQIVASKMIADLDVVNAPEAIGITSLGGTSNGTWQYKIGNGTWTAFDFASNSGKALLLDATDNIRFVPNAGYKGTIGDGITFRAWDKTGSENAGTYVATSGKTGVDGIFSAQTASASITVADMTAPVLSTAKVVGNELSLTYSENRSSTSNPDAGDFTVTVNGSTVNVSSVWTPSPTSPQVVLTLASAVLQRDTVTISYADIGTANPIKDTANNLAANLTDASVTNNTRPPVTLTTLAPLTAVTATEDTEQVITFAQLAANGDEAGYQVAFKVTAVNGSLKIGASAQTATAYDSSTNAIIDSTHNAYWTPESNVNGSAVTAFQVVAVDDVGNTSSTDMPVQLAVSAVNDAPSISFASGPITTDFDPSTYDQSHRILDAGNGKFLLVGTSGNSDNLTIARYNADGSLDSSYGVAGKVVTNLSLRSFFDATMDAAGNVFLSVRTNSNSGIYSVIKVDGTGTVDAGFSSDGIAETALGVRYGYAIAAQTDGKAVVASYKTVNFMNDIFVERFNADGSLDTTFGDVDTNSGVGAKLGYTSWNAGADESPDDILIQADGKIIVVGYSYDDNTGLEPIAIRRFNPDGTPDTGFGSQGTILETNSGAWSIYSNYFSDSRAALQSDGKLVVAASADGDALVLARYTSSGVLDTSFGNGGKVAVDGNATNWILTGASDIKIDATGNIFVLGDDGLVVAKFLPNGDLDSAFGQNGIANISLDGYAYGSSLSLTSGGKILITGGYEEPVNDDGQFMVVRLNADGTQDATFGGAKSYELGSAPMVLGTGAQIADPDVTDYSGFTITVARDGGANAQDVFSASGNLELATGGVLNYNGSQIGTYTNAAGTLTLTLGNQAYGSIDGNTLNTIAQSIVYNNTATAIPQDPTIGLKWTVNDHNTGNSQGTGAAMSATTVQSLVLAPDATAPTLDDWTADANGDNAIGITENIVLSFSENVLRGNGNIVIKNVSDDSVVETIAVTDTTKISISGKTVTINPATNLQFQTDYYFTVASGAFKDAAGNDFAGITDSSLSFTTTTPQSSASVSVNHSLTSIDPDGVTSVSLATSNGLNISGLENSLATGLPKNVKMPLGQFGFTIEGLANGGTATMSMTTDSSFKQFSFFKKSLVTGRWVNIASGVSIDTATNRATVNFSLVDGGEFDADRIANGVIVDPGGLAENSLLPFVFENSTEVGSVAVVNESQVNGTLSYEITGGVDQNLFVLDAATGTLAFAAAPDFENPTDDGADNSYNLQVTIRGSNGGTEIQNLTVAVLNVIENGETPGVVQLSLAAEIEPTLIAPPTENNFVPPSLAPAPVVEAAPLTTLPAIAEPPPPPTVLEPQALSQSLDSDPFSPPPPSSTPSQSNIPPFPPGPAAAPTPETTPPFLPGLTAAEQGGFQVALVARPAAGGDVLLVNRPLSDIAITAGERISVSIPAQAFAHTSSAAVVTLSAKLEDDAPLPAWMRFNPLTGTFEGTPPPEFKGELAVRVIARDKAGREAVQVFRIGVGRGEVNAERGTERSGNPEQRQPLAPQRGALFDKMGKPSLAKQFDRHGGAARHAETNELIVAARKAAEALSVSGRV
jgi:uncharacterized delta-60 repeat protein